MKTQPAAAYRKKNHNSPITNHQSQFSKRSTIMSTTRFLARGLVALFSVIFLAGISFGQNLVITANSNFSGSGTYNIAGNITNAGVAGAKTINGIVNLKGSSGQDIGTLTNGAINFQTLQATVAASTKAFKVSSTVSTLIDVAFSGASFDLGVHQLTIGGSITNTGTGGSAYVFNGSGAEVVYASASAGTQHMWNTAYDKLTLNGTPTDYDFLGTSTVTVANTFSHSGSGTLNVNNSLTLSAGYTFATISNIAAGKTLALGTTGSIAAITDINATANLVNSSGALTITGLTDNHGTITAAANGGAITFTNAANNHGAITGGAGLVAFSNALTTAGAVTAGQGDMTIAALATISSGGSVVGATGADITFNGNVDNAATGGISVSGSGLVTFSGATFTNTGTLSFGGTSTALYSRAGNQDVASTSYVNFKTAGSGIKLAGGDLSASSSFDNGGASDNAVTLNMGTYALTLPSTVDNTSSTVQFGGQSNGRIIASGVVEYNASGVVTQYVQGSGTVSYASLLLSGSGSTKEISNTNSGGQVRTTSGLTIGTGVTADVKSDGTLIVHGGDLTVDGSLSNAGVVTVE